MKKKLIIMGLSMLLGILALAPTALAASETAMPDPQATFEGSFAQVTAIEGNIVTLKMAAFPPRGADSAPDIDEFQPGDLPAAEGDFFPGFDGEKPAPSDKGKDEMPGGIPLPDSAEGFGPVPDMSGAENAPPPSQFPEDSEQNSKSYDLSGVAVSLQQGSEISDAGLDDISVGDILLLHFDDEGELSAVTIWRYRQEEQHT